MKRTLVWMILAGLAIAFALYLSRPRTHLNVTPDAEQAIEKAKRR